MTALISQMMMPTGAEAAGLRASVAGVSAEMPVQAGYFAALIARFGGLPGADGGEPAILPDGADLPADGRLLPDDLPFVAGDEALPSALSAPDGFAVRILAVPAGGAAADTAVPLPPARPSTAPAPVMPQPVADDLPAGDEVPYLDMFRRGAVALSVDGQMQRMETAGPVASGAMQAALSAMNLNTALQSSADPAAMLSLSGAPQTSAQPAAQGAERALPGWTLSTPLHQAQQWGDEVGQRIRWMVGNQVQAAELRINPPQLGPIEVRVSVHNDQMNVTFLSQHGLVRDALEDAIPRLRDMLAQQGYASVNVDVSEHPASHGEGNDGDHAALAGDASAPRDDAVDAAARPAVYLSSTKSGFIDYYA